MSKLPDCPLRINRIELGKKKQLVCSGGMNFLSVGEDAALCHHCLVLEPRHYELLHCPHGEIYTILNNKPIGQFIIEYDVVCDSTTEQERCSQCPNRIRRINDSPE